LKAISSYGIKGKYLLLPVMLCLMLNDCIHPFYPELEKYQSLLTIDARLTDEENVSAYVKLSRTSDLPDEKPRMVDGAIVTVTDNLGNTTYFTEVSDGIYRTDSTVFTGVPGREYTLRIMTPDGKEYASESCRLAPGREIDNVYFEKASQTLDNGEFQEGIMICADARESSENKCFRWTYEELWKFSVPYPVTHVYIDEHNVIEVPVKNETCYARRKPEQPEIESVNPALNKEIVRKPVLFIASANSDRLLLRYSIEVSLFTISDEEYEFWRLVKEINSSGGDIFDRQPFPSMTNVYCESDPDEKVLGYFQVCGASRKRIYISPEEILPLGLPGFEYGCGLTMKGPQDYLSEKPPSFDLIYAGFIAMGYNFIYPVFLTGSLNSLDRLVFTTRDCSDCSVSGESVPPYFWIDSE
jgi:hypothetical protein